MPNIDSMTDLFNWLSSGWFTTKASLEAGLGTYSWVLHVAGGVTLQVALALVLRLRPSHLVPWFGVLGLELANEWNDYIAASRIGEGSFAAMASDVVLTMALPTLVLVVARRWPAAATEADPAVEEPVSDLA